ncbi:MAG TPA: branched-chain amino acid ABC transporter ATP-binding protein/permease [Pseudolabrys sp.]|nr:branched-chain amino acid ABC transporter ATP-binding protein/permease [Pseudolabrys sp.]
MRGMRPALIALALVSLTALPLATGGTYYTYLGVIIGIYGIVAVGLNILSGYAGQFSLGHAAFMAMGAYTTALITKALSGSPVFYLSGAHVWLGILCGTTVAALSGILLAIPALRVRGPYLAMVTIAFGWVVWKILQEWVGVTGGDLGISSIPKPQIGTFRLETRHFYYVVLVFFIAALSLQHRLIASRFGMRVRAIKYSEIAVSSVGVDVYRLKVVVFVISAAFAGFGGTLFAHQQNYISPDNFQFFSSVFFLLAVLFGGAGTSLGPVIGAAFLIILPEMLHDFDHYRLIVYACLILITLYVLPRGVMGLFDLPVKRKIDTRAGIQPGERIESLPPVAGANLRVEALSRSFGGLLALSDVGFEIEGGSIHALIGPNGAGKTTLINIVSGVYRPDSGRILMDGSEVSISSMHVAAQRGIVRTFQTLKLFGDMTVIEHVLIALPSRSRSILYDAVMRSRRAREESESHLHQARALLHLLGIAHLEQAPANSLAYGHRRLLEIARALAVRPRILLLDEPAAGLVAEEIRALAAVIRTLKQIGMTILLVEHHMELVLSVSDRITVLDHGAVIADGRPADIRRNENVIQAYLGPSHAAA